MRNISFDNPYWLLLAIPLAAALLIPYFISVSKDNRTKGWVASLVIHILIIIFVSLSAAGLVHTTVMTRTKLYVVADVSYSSDRNLDEIDEYIKQIEKKLVAILVNPAFGTWSGVSLKCAERQTCALFLTRIVSVIL